MKNQKFILVFIFILSQGIAWSQKEYADTVNVFLDRECNPQNSYALEVKNFVVYVPDTTYENYSKMYYDTTNAFGMSKGSIVPFSNKGVELLNSLLIEKGRFCCIYDTKNKNWLNSIRYIFTNKCPRSYKELLYLGEKRILMIVNICRNVMPRRSGKK